MTRNQIEYRAHLENVRHNLATEGETNRSNVARETETNRSNLASEKETNRSNVAREVETHRANTTKEAELERNNRAVLAFNEKKLKHETAVAVTNSIINVAKTAAQVAAMGA